MSSPLAIEPMKVEDFDTLAGLDLLEGDDLSPPGIMMCWPQSTPKNNAFRTRWSAQQQKEMFMHDPTVRFMKVVDTSKPNAPPIAIGRWHRYVKGFQPDFLPLELYGTGPNANNEEPSRHGLKGVAHQALITEWMNGRLEWCVQRPQWMLTTLKTREPERRRGAGGLLINWGVQEAIREGIPAYLEAVPEAKSLYEKYGFKQIGEQTFDLRAHGLPTVLVVARMAANVR